MSRLSEAFIMRAMNINHPKVQDFRGLSVETEYSPMNLRKGLYDSEYRVGVKYEYKFVVQGSPNKATKEHILINASSSFCNEVYGEFKGLIFELQRELSAFDNCRAKEIAYELEERMFK